MKDLWGKFMLAVLLLSQIAIPFIWLYGAMNYSPPRGRLILACSAGLWSCTIFIRIKNHPIVDVAFKNGVAILISVFIRNIPYIFFRVFYVWEAVFYTVVLYVYLRTIWKEGY
ncbi:MAG: hypothetical protein LKE33_05985 [Acidaminococcus sp.]|jgi:hypothetical protein|nr:hypothetical protein [Acidaminococcus sp.]MCI2116635.1 hypothetical protein [Acidaminococcus sp.]